MIRRFGKLVTKLQTMGRIWKALANLYTTIEIARLERDEARHIRRMERLSEDRKIKAKQAEDKKEMEMLQHGFVKDKLSKHFVQPDHALQMIVKAVEVKLADDPRKDAIIDLLTDLDDLDKARFKPYAREFLWLPVICPLTGREFESALLKEPLYSIANIVWLKKMVVRLVYLNLAVVRHELPMVM